MKEINSISVAQFANAFLAGANNLESKKEWINELNVFPVPDGDTGTNMCMTIMSAAKTVTELEDPTMKTLSKAISSGSLRGARGNSGVILSQLFRGFSKVIGKADVITTDVLSEAMQKAVETAYKAVMKPKEGTILTVARGAADKALEMVEVTDDIVYFVDEVIKEAERTLAKTPDMLPVLKQAGVVDSGGQGLVCILQGGYDYLIGKDVKLTIGDEDEAPKKEADEVPYTYHADYVITLSKSFSNKSEREFKSYLESVGGHVRVAWNKDEITVSIRTDELGNVINKSLELGVLTKIDIKNIQSEYDKTIKKESSKKAASEIADKTHSGNKETEENCEPKEPAKEMGFVSVSIGEGMNSIFNELGCDYIIEGGQTMNPSTDDVLSAIEKVNAKNVFVLPNNKNIILAANQAASICEDKNIIVLPTTTIPQGITAIINFIPDQSVEDNQSRMEEEIKNVKTGQVTYAVRDTVIDDKEISEGDYMGIGDSGILAVNKDMNQVFIDMLKELVDDSTAIITIYYGDEVDEKDAISLGKRVEEDFDSLEVEVQSGGQPVYYYVASVE
ncbi:MAG: DAK2 domain-containing protein [Lachnospiraceae bacterium]|nr:DAK2 domain-containing protein [Lachnospiraceae bacterium]